ncbi:histidine--tRNA ligase [Mycoplasma ovis]|uniref:histidine--tRNA ligase n=1 Tax=Mycoplasma ovis TaxID=171632 RepID=UPI000429857C|nr:histidine--tRNA ligase [Mycoplasma ovis]
MKEEKVIKILKKPKGTRALFEEEINKREFLVQKLSYWARSIGFKKIQTPTFERSSIFLDSNNPEGEILKKELFFLKNEDYVLKPEETAIVARTIASEKLLSCNPSPLKFFYSSQCFRHERPQNQRFREFTQFGLEIIKASSLAYEVELIYMLDSFFKNTLNLGLLKLRVNFLSNKETRRKWTKELTKYFLKNNEGLSNNSLERIKNNPIRILDDEKDSLLDIVKKAPKIQQFLSEEELERIKKIKRFLSELGVDYTWDETLVRGLDYYTGIVFEWNYRGLGVAGGGRYDELFNKFSHLSKDLKDVPSVGLAIGIERLIHSLEKSEYEWPTQPNKKVYLCNLFPEVESKIIELIKKLRDNDLEVESNWELKDLKSHFKFSEKQNIKWLLIYGAKEKENNEIILKEQNKSFQISFPLSKDEDLIRELQNLVEH